MLIVDASCLYEVLVGGPKAAGIRARMTADRDHAAPHIIDVEVFGVIRREFLRGHLDPTAAALAVDNLADWAGDRFPHSPFLRRAWELRSRVRGWDAMYVAVAEAFQATLLTTDGRLGGAPGLQCSIDVV
jgi:predicted nucleic acid-binding protein